MSEREWKRLDGVGRVEEGLLSNGEADLQRLIATAPSTKLRHRENEGALPMRAVELSLQCPSPGAMGRPLPTKSGEVVVLADRRQ